jgi:hypothetical protein
MKIDNTSIYHLEVQKYVQIKSSKGTTAKANIQKNKIKTKTNKRFISNKRKIYIIGHVEGKCQAKKYHLQFTSQRIYYP